MSYLQDYEGDTHGPMWMPHTQAVCLRADDTHIHAHRPTRENLPSVLEDLLSVTQSSKGVFPVLYTDTPFLKPRP